MFESVRLKLTAWYVGILFVILIIFSGIIYQVGVLQIEENYILSLTRAKARMIGTTPPRSLPKNWRQMTYELSEIDAKDFNLDLVLAKKFLLRNILMINLGVLSISSFLAYFLAGKTLNPIKEMMEDQEVFITDASHELKTPLTAMKTSLEVALRNKKNKKADLVKVLEENLLDVNNLKLLTEKLLTLVSYQENNSKLNKITFSLKDLSENLKKKFKPLIKKKKIRLEIKTRNKKVFLDKEKIEQLLVILLDNAIKYSPDGSKILLSMKVEKNEFLIKVKDSGVGINEEDLDHIFDRFYKSDKSRSQNDNRSFGLGLSIAKKIVFLHKGRISVESKPKKGSKFSVVIPL